MREKELRIALVCSGGISLAIYMHGVTKEVLKLARASASLHAVKDRRRRASAGFFDQARRGDAEFDTEAIYFELLREIGRTVELRVIVDVIAGASAGGINGTMLARALAHDLPMGELRDLWLDNGDVGVLLASDARAGRWSKWFIRPLIWAAERLGIIDLAQDLEIRERLSLFLRSRWFEPPLDGSTMAALMLDAASIMGEPRDARASLLPSGQPLDLFVTLTDFNGYSQLVQIHDPPLIHEREHHHVLRFRYRRNATAPAESDFASDNVPALAFAARATSSFPGAFPPAQIAEMDRLLADRGIVWPRRAHFIARNFGAHLRANIDPATVPYLDGSILNNRPFREAIGAIQMRPAYRQVDRRLVYIDPDPPPPTTPTRRPLPGFFSTLRSSISDIPLVQPITDELAWVAAYNRRARRLKSIVESARPHVSDLVTAVIGRPSADLSSAHQISAWREEVNAVVAREAGFAYAGYVRLKLAAVRAFVAELIVELRGVPASSPLSRVVSEIVDLWAEKQEMVFAPSDAAALQRERPTGAVPPWIEFLLAFDVRYRERRLHFLIEGQNRLYGLLDEPRFADLQPSAVDVLKRRLYSALDDLHGRVRAQRFSDEVRDLVAEIFPTVPSPTQMRHLRDYASAFVARQSARIDVLIARLAAEIDLDANTRDIDELLEELAPPEWTPQARQEVLIHYLGFPFWDVLTLALADGRDISEINEILVDRISPQDVHALPDFAGAASLKGTRFGHFAAFLSRTYRENDYLLGRLHGIDRLIDIVVDCAGPAATTGLDIGGFKTRAFRSVLDAEEASLPHCADLIAALRRAL